MEATISNSAWTEAEDATLARLRAEGLSAREMSVSLARSYYATRTRLYILVAQGVIAKLNHDGLEVRNVKTRARRAARLKDNANSVIAAFPNSKDAGYVVGVLYGDGFVHQRAQSLCLSTRDASFADAFFAAVTSALGPGAKRGGRLYELKEVGGVTYTDVFFEEVFFHRKYIVAQFVEHVTGSTTTREWKIDVDAAMKRGFEYCAGVVQGLFDSDGSIRRQGNTVEIVLSTASHRGAESLHELLLRMHFCATLSNVDSKGMKRVRIAAKSVEQYVDQISSRIEYKRAVLDELLQRRKAG